MADNRSKREKLEAVINPNSGATEGERSNARSLLAKLKPEPDTWRGLRAALETERPQPRKPSPYNFDDIEDLLRRFRGGFTTNANDYRRWAEGTFSNDYMYTDDKTYPPGSRGEDPLGTTAEQEILDHWCKHRGHTWIVIGQGMLHTDIKRCTVCGEYDPARKKEARSGSTER